MPTLYRVYMTILAERLKEEIEMKGIISKSQDLGKDWEQLIMFMC